jgi:hypothetical protein
MRAGATMLQYRPNARRQRDTSPPHNISVKVRPTYSGRNRSNRGEEGGKGEHDTADDGGGVGNSDNDGDDDDDDGDDDDVEGIGASPTSAGGEVNMIS